MTTRRYRWKASDSVGTVAATSPLHAGVDLDNFQHSPSLREHVL
ncbi:MAG: hypothetical protein RR740_15675 [Pseudomonas sp.]